MCARAHSSSLSGGERGGFYSRFPFVHDHLLKWPPSPSTSEGLPCRRRTPYPFMSAAPNSALSSTSRSQFVPPPKKQVR